MKTLCKILLFTSCQDRYMQRDFVSPRNLRSVQCERIDL